jgi:long-chain acyl-CoA synthetase
LDAPTIPGLLRARAAATPATLAYVELDLANERRHVTWGDFASRVERLAGALLTCGIDASDRVAILGPNSIDWETAQHASLACGATVAGIDPNYPRDQLDEVIRQLRPAMVFAEDTSFLERIDQKALAELKLASVFRLSSEGSSLGAVPLDELLVPRPQGNSGWPHVDVGVGGIITFSSGTTGTPKPIAYTHAQIRDAIRAITGAFPDIGPDDRLLCWLPLANLFQRMINFCALAVGARSYVTGDPRSVMTHLTAAKPHVFIGVPRFFGRVHAGITEKLQKTAWPMRTVTAWAVKSGHRRAQAGRTAAPLGARDRLAALIADRLVLSRIRAIFGGHVRYLVSGSAPMQKELLEWFDAVGLSVYEAYGVSEDIVPIAINHPGQRRLGSVGRPLAPNNIRLAPDGEILVGGPGVFSGYMMGLEDLPRPNAEGFWATGDLGSLDQDGFLSIQGRKSDTFKTSAGRWVNPTRVEDCLRRIPYVEHAVILGAYRKATVAVLSVDTKQLNNRSGGNLTADCRDTGRGMDTQTQVMLLADLDKVLEAVPPHERPAAVLIVTTGFSIAGGELTTNLKLRRAEVERKYAREVENLYQTLGQSKGHPAALPGQLPIRVA